MLSESFQLYFQNTSALVQSLTIKYDIQNQLLNTYMKSAGYTVDDDDPSTWKYNMNLAGLYHSTDAAMTVRSLDTKEEISFDKETLEDHPRTLLYYSQGQDGYSLLVNEYPNQEILIKGITESLSLDDIVNADNLSILHYSSDYVYSNELTLIQRVQSWINIYYQRNFNSDWCATNPYYALNFLGGMGQLLIPIFMIIRADLAGTEEASQFEIWSELSGHFGLDAYKPYLTLAQSIWLYRNIVNIRKNMGQQDILVELYENLLEPDGMMIKRLDYYLNETTLQSTKERTVQFSLTDFESEDVDQASGDVLSTTDVYELTEEVAPDNDRLSTQAITDTNATAKALRYNQLPTKIMRADQDSTSVTENINLLAYKGRYWAWLAYLGYYTTDITIEMPNSNSIVLNPLDALRLYIYAGKMAQGITLADLPTITVSQVIPSSYPTAAELTPLIGSATDVTDNITSDVIKDMLDNLVYLDTVKTVSDFTDFVDSVHNQDVRFNLYSSVMPTQQSKANIIDIANGLVKTQSIDLSDGSVTSYATWLFNNGIETTNYDDQDWYDLTANILSAVVDYSDNQTSIGSRQSAVVAIVNLLTSYRIMILEGTTNGRATEIEWQETFVSPMVSGAAMTAYVDPSCYITHLSETATHTTFSELIENGPDFDMENTAEEIVIGIGEEIIVPDPENEVDMIIQVPSADLITPSMLGLSD